MFYHFQCEPRLFQYEDYYVKATSKKEAKRKLLVHYDLDVLSVSKIFAAEPDREAMVWRAEQNVITRKLNTSYIDCQKNKPEGEYID